MPKRKTAKRKSAKKKASKRRTMSGAVPTNVLVARRNYLDTLIKKRGGEGVKPAKLTHRRPKAAAKLAAKTRKRRRRK